MNLTLRYIALAVLSIFSLHYLASYTSVTYQTQVDTLTSSWSSSSDPKLAAASASNGVSISYAATPKANATFVVLCREGEINGILESLHLLETTFNDRPHHRYPYVFLNDKPFSDNFKLRITRAVSSSVEFGLVPPEMWDIPPHIDLDKARKAWAKAGLRGMPYGDSQSYRQMCRFQSGYFFRHPLLLKYKYYWRVEPNVKYFCDLTEFDPFRFMQQNKKKYGFVLAMHEIPGTVTTLWIHVRSWYEKHRDLLAQNNMFGLVTQNNGRGYNKVSLSTSLHLNPSYTLHAPSSTHIPHIFASFHIILTTNPFFARKKKVSFLVKLRDSRYGLLSLRCLPLLLQSPRSSRWLLLRTMG